MFSLICARIKRLSKQLWGWWFETPACSLRRHCNVMQPFCLTADENLGKRSSPTVFKWPLMTPWKGFMVDHRFCLVLVYLLSHYDDVIMGTIASQITSLTSVYSTVYSGADQSKHQSSASLAFVWGIHRGPVNSPHKWPVTRKMFPFDDVIMLIADFPDCPRGSGGAFVLITFSW